MIVMLAFMVIVLISGKVITMGSSTYEPWRSGQRSPCCKWRYSML